MTAAALFNPTYARPRRRRPPLGALIGALIGIGIMLASNFKLGTTARNAACDGLVDAIDTGTGAGTIAIRTGSPPTNVGDASSGTLLGTCTFSATAFGAASTGVATAAAITSDTNADASGDAGYFRVYKGAGADTAALFQGTAGNSGDTPDMTFDNKSIVAGGTIAISAFTVTVPIQ
jgi:hypothetical protein